MNKKKATMWIFQVLFSNAIFDFIDVYKTPNGIAQEKKTQNAAILGNVMSQLNLIY